RNARSALSVWSACSLQNSQSCKCVLSQSRSESARPSTLAFATSCKARVCKFSLMPRLLEGRHGVHRARDTAATSPSKRECSKLPPSLRSATLPESAGPALRGKWQEFSVAKSARLLLSPASALDRTAKVRFRL